MLPLCDYSGGVLTGTQLKAHKFVGAWRYVLGPAGEEPKNLTPAEVEGILGEGAVLGCLYETSGEMWTKDGGKVAAEDFQKRLEALAKAAAYPELSTAAGWFAQDVPVDAGTDPDAYIQGVASVIGLDRTAGYGQYGVVKNWMDNGLLGALDYGSFMALQTSGGSGGAWDKRAVGRQTGYGVNVDGVSVDLDYFAWYDSSQILDATDYYGQFPSPIPPKPKSNRRVSDGTHTLVHAAREAKVSVQHVSFETNLHAASAERAAFVDYLSAGNWSVLHVEHAGPNDYMPKGLVYYI